MKNLRFCLLLLGIEGVFSQYIANDVVSDYAQVKELLAQYYRKHAKKAGNDYDPSVVRNQATSKMFYDGTEATVNRLIWTEVFENDIILTLPQAEALLTESAGSRNKRQASPSAYSFWPNLTVSYEFAYNDANFKNLIRSALRHIEHNTCIRFKENGGDRDGLRYFRGNGCWSNVGRTGGRQLVSIGYGCDSLGIVAHETLHALGLWHEQSRSDRDQYININFWRIIRGTEGNFEKRTALTSDNMGQPYDLGSVMHYGAKAFTSDWTANTVETKDKRFQNTIGQRDGISFKDAKMINLRYCTGVCRTTLPCANEGYTDPNDCQKCRCPKGYGGTYCQELERSSCGEELVATQGYQILRSGPVYANSHCVWRIRSPAGQKLELNIDSVNFPCLDSCTSFVEIKATRSKTATGARLCCRAAGPFYSEDDDIILIFKGDSQIQPGYNGFTARYRYYGDSTNVKPAFTYTTRKTTTYKPQTSTTPRLKTPYPTASWGIWGQWSECSQSCGGCGFRTRVRGCYGGNRVCPGSEHQREHCNTQPCPVTKVIGSCNGRILLPCYLVDRMTFGDQALSSGDNPRRSPRNVKDSVDFSEKNALTLKTSTETMSSSRFGICEKRFKYECPTSLLTITLGWKGDKLKRNEPPPSPSSNENSAECCTGYYLSNGKCLPQ
uniref:Zinc metalloproteinase n=1 Tax=Haemonchus contortus TaxID=6289 RepID=A0A7I5E671_HAECO|nr:Peptidase M12A and CUB and Thrombospondin domain containing protein [Haemonchus contortus]